MIHQYINNGYHIVLDVNSGSVHVVDPVVYDAVEVVSGLVPEMEKPEPLSAKVKSDVFDRLWGRYTPEELGEALDPPLSRSGVNHRLQRILAFAADLPGG